MEIPRNSNSEYAKISTRLKSGEIKIPQFQREFVWSKESSAKLIDSMLKGYPIGSFIYWKTKTKLNVIRNIGNINFPDIVDGSDDTIYYVLDGQQRITSLFAAFEGEMISRKDDKKEDFSKIYLDLDANLDGDEEVVVISQKDGRTYISLKDLLESNLNILINYKDYYSKIQKYRDIINKYQFSEIQVECDIDEATEIFTRLNVGGKPLSVFEIVVAKTYDEVSGFDLSQKYDKLIEELDSKNYGTIPNSVFIQTISTFICGECSKKALLNLSKESVINITAEAYDCILHACDYFKAAYRIPVSALLPYDALIIPFAYYFYKNGKRNPEGVQQKYLKDYFWRVALTERFSSSMETRVAQDIKRIDKIFENILSEYDTPVDIRVAKFINNGNFRVGAAWSKAILCLYSNEIPKKFNNDTDVNISNDYLKQSNSKNYHHFFPKAYLKRVGVDEEKANNIANITIVDDFLNKKVIRDKAPSDYMESFKTVNPNIEETMKSHLIDINNDEIFTNNYNTFLDNRIKRIIEKLKEKIIITNMDNIDN